MNKEKELTPKQEAFCVYYVAIGEDTYGNALRAALEAGYAESSAGVAGHRLLKNDKIKERILELHSQHMNRNMITVDKVLSDLEHYKLMAAKDRQYSVAKSCVELQGKYLSMFTDVVHQTNEDLPKLTEEEKAKVRIAVETLVPGSPVEEQKRAEIREKNTA